jgi:hypothetical protein
MKIIIFVEIKFKNILELPFSKIPDSPLYSMAIVGCAKRARLFVL